MKINKNLVEVVLVEEIFGAIIIENNIIKYTTLSEHSQIFETINCNEINIYEFVFKCKEWAYKCGYIIDSGYHKHHINYFKAHVYGWVSENIDIKTEFGAPTEIEAVLEVCLFILDN